MTVGFDVLRRVVAPLGALRARRRGSAVRAAGSRRRGGPAGAGVGGAGVGGAGVGGVGVGGAAGGGVGVGPGVTSTTSRVLGVGNPQATAIADARAARMRHLDETGVYVHVIADGGMSTGGDLAKAVVCGADGVMLGSPLARATEAPAGGASWSMAN